MRFKREHLLVFVVLCVTGYLPGFAEPGRHSALQVRTPKALPPQIFDMSQFDDVIEIETRTLPKYMDFEGSKLKPITMVKIGCYCDTAHNAAASKTAYLNLWYCDGDTLGSRQILDLPVKKRDRVAIVLRSRPDQYSSAEIAAIAGALVQLRLKLSLNSNAIAMVRVPEQNLEAFAGELRKHNFFPYNEVSGRLNVMIPLTLESSNGHRTVLCFAPGQ